MFLAKIFCLFFRQNVSPKCFVNAAIEGWDALHANPTVGSLGKDILNFMSGANCYRLDKYVLKVGTLSTPTQPLAAWERASGK